MLIFDLNMFIPFLNGVKLQFFYFVSNLNFSNTYLVFFMEKKLNEGSEKVEIWVAFNFDHLQQKSMQLFMVKMG